MGLPRWWEPRKIEKSTILKKHFFASKPQSCGSNRRGESLEYKVPEERNSDPPFHTAEETLNL